MGREWTRYEGTAQRDLFLQLRQRFLGRHRAGGGWVADVGSGPGRFTADLAEPPCRAVLLDLSIEMLREARRHLVRAEISAALVRGDARTIPLGPGKFACVAALGNPLGFAGTDADSLLGGLLSLTAPRGRVILEIVCGPGERSRYFSRLPPKAVGRLLAAPVNLVRARVEREGFQRITDSKPRSNSFRRYQVPELVGRLVQEGFAVDEILAVAPALGGEPERCTTVRSDALAWSRLIELEEVLGHTEVRQTHAAAVLITAHRITDRRVAAPAR